MMTISSLTSNRKFDVAFFIVTDNDHPSSIPTSVPPSYPNDDVALGLPEISPEMVTPSPHQSPIESIIIPQLTKKAGKDFI